jgi:putative transcriptional regulator
VWHLAYWTGSWVLTIAIAACGPKFLWDYNPSISIVAILVATIIGAGWILMNRKYTNGLDEMHRKVAMDANAIALGVGVAGGMSYSMFRRCKCHILRCGNKSPGHAHWGNLFYRIYCR